MWSLRVSDLDSWLGYIEPEREEFEVTTEQFLAYLRRQAPQTDAMRAGLAFHALLEHAAPGEELDTDLGGVQSGDFRFFCGPDLEVALPPVREQPVERIYQTPSGPVLLRGKTDGLHGLEVTDYKLTLGTFDAERYARSLQWRAYLDMTDCRRFRYLVFTGKLQAQNVWLHEVHELALWSYPEMHAEVQERVAELASFVVQHVPEMVTSRTVVGAGR